MNKWEIDPNGSSKEYYANFVCDIDKEGYFWAAATVKWDGCIHFNKAGNVPFSEEYGSPTSNKPRDSAACDDYIHICNLDDFIRKLLALRKTCKKYFPSQEAWNKQI